MRKLRMKAQLAKKSTELHLAEIDELKDKCKRLKVQKSKFVDRSNAEITRVRNVRDNDYVQYTNHVRDLREDL